MPTTDDASPVCPYGFTMTLANVQNPNGGEWYVCDCFDCADDDRAADER